MKVTSARGGVSQTGAPQAQKNIGGLARGDTFTATVAGVSGGEVFLNLPGGGQLRAKSKNPGALQTGEKLSFTVEANENGQVFVKMSKDNEKNLLRIAAKALTDAGLSANDEKNLLAAKSVIEKGLSPDAETLRKAAFGMTLETMTMEKLMFLLEENIEVDGHNLKQLNNCVINKNGLTAEINRLIEKVLNLPKSQKDSAIRALLGGSASGDEKSLKKALFLDVSAEKEFGSYYKRLYGAVSKLLGETPANPSTRELIDSAKTIKSAIDFQNEINEYKYYMQIPFVLDGNTGQGELYVFKDTGKSSGLKKHATALLCLDLSIGRVEAFIVKNERSVGCVFGLSEPKYIKLFKDNAFELHKLLAQKGFRLEQAVFEPLEGAFSLLKERPGDIKKPGAKKFTFDMKA